MSTLETGSESNRIISEEKAALMVEVAQLYFKEQCTQSEIARRLQVSNATISRLLKEAQDRKLVEIVIHYPISTASDLEKRLVDHFGLKEAHVLSTANRQYALLVKQIGQLAARVLMNQIKDGMTLSISWGQTVLAAAQAVQVYRPIHVRVAQMEGAHDDERLEGSNAVRILGDLFGNDISVIPSPLILKSVEIRRVLMEEPLVRESLAVAEHADIAMIGIGSLNSEVSNWHQTPYLSMQDLNHIIAHGAVGEICGTFFDNRGNPLDIEFNKRIVSIDIRSLCKIPVVIGVSAGMQKAKAILAALRGGYINTLVTDPDVALYLLRESKTVKANS